MKEFIDQMKNLGVRVEEVDKGEYADSFYKFILPFGVAYNIKPSEAYYGYNHWVKCIEIEKVE